MAQMKYFYELTVASSPHVHSPVTTRTIMRDVVIALLPALAGSVYFFGLRALMVTLVSVAACVFFEWAYCKLTKTCCKVYDLSAAVTGVLLAFVCPVTIPYWCILIGDFFAIVVVKALFGGIGRNIVNPALAGRAFMFSYPALMTRWVKPGFQNAAGIFNTVDAVTGATPLAQMGKGMLPEATVSELFLGNIGGCIGETSALLLLLGLQFQMLILLSLQTYRIVG
jgi:electron transport complex protein RnfD